MMMLLAGAAEAATPTMKRMNGYGLNTAFDITGDGKRDRIEFIHHAYGASYDRVTFRVNGKTCFSKKSNWQYYDFYAYHLTLRNGRKYILYFSRGEHEIGDLGGLLCWGGGGLWEAVNFARFNRMHHSLGYFFSVQSAKVYDNRVRVWMEGSSNGLARFKVYADAGYVNGRMTPLIMNVKFSNVRNWGNGFTGAGKWYTASRNLQGYTTYNGTGKSFIIRSGQKVMLEKYYANPYYRRILVRLQNGRRAWINDNFNRGDTFFREVYYWA